MQLLSQLDRVDPIKSNRKGTYRAKEHAGKAQVNRQVLLGGGVGGREGGAGAASCAN